MEQTKQAKMSCVNGVMRRMWRDSSSAAHSTISTPIHTPVAARYWLKSSLNSSASFESLMVIAVIGPVGRSTSSGWQPRSEWAPPATQFISRYSLSPMRLSVSCSTRAPSATVEKSVANSMKSAAESVFEA